MISNNPAFLQEQDFQAKHSDLLQAARKGKAWEPADNPRFGLCSQLVTSNWRYVSRIANIDISDVPDAEEPSLSEMLKAASSGPVGTVVRVSLPPLNCRNMNLDISDRLCDASRRLTKEELCRLNEAKAAQVERVMVGVSIMPGGVTYVSQVSDRGFEFSKLCDPDER